MSKRPLCQLLLFLAIGIVICKCLGISWLWKSPTGILPLEWAQKKQYATVTGTVYAQEENTYQNQTYTYLYLKKSNLFIQSKKYPIRNIKCTLEGQMKNFLDCEIVLTGTLCLPAQSTNPGEFDQKLWESSRKIDFYLTDITEWEITQKAKGISRFTSQIKQNGKKLLFEIFPEEQAAILYAMILGEKSELENETKNQFQAAGISHIIAISGLHMSLIGMGIWTVCKWIGLPMALAAINSVFFLLGYGIILNNPTTAFRALLMFVIMMGAKLLGRSYDLLSALAAAGIILLFDNPDLLDNSGFQLSFSAVLGMGCYCRLEEEIFQTIWKTKGTWWSSFRSGISLWFFSLPVVLHSFYQVSVLGILINLLVIPLMSVVLGSGLLSILLGFCNVGLGSIAGIPAFFLLKGYALAGEWAELCSFGMWTPGKPQMWQIILYYILLFVVAYGLKGVGKIWEDKEKRKHIVWIVTEIVVKVLLILIISIPWSSSQKVSVLDVGQGDGIVLQSNGNSILVDGGSSSRKQIGKYVLLPYFKYEGIAYLDLILITHPDEDHMNGAVEVLEESQKGWFQVGAVGMPEWMRDTQEGLHIKRLAQMSGIEVLYLEAGDQITFGSTKLQILHPINNNPAEDTNSGSLVFVWETKNGTGLFTGDLPADQEIGLLHKLEKCTFLKVGHHGSNHSTTEELLKVVQPQIALISCGKKNRYGHPGNELIQRLEKYDCEIYRTDLQGALTIDLDKGILSIKEE